MESINSKIVPHSKLKRLPKPVDETISAVPGEWRFDLDVSKGFDSHVRKSVPFYGEIQRMAVELSEFFVRDQSLVYDLGSSTGETLHLLSTAHAGKQDVHFIGFDLSESMVDEATKKVMRPNVQFIHKNLIDVKFCAPASLMTALFTLQFLTLTERRDLLKRVYDGLMEGGGFLIVEKVLAEHSSFQEIWTDLHWDFKQRQGLTPEQILQKANSIRGVLNPISTQENLDLLHQTGFSRVEVFFKWYNWAGLIAVKSKARTPLSRPEFKDGDS